MSAMTASQSLPKAAFWMGCSLCCTLLMTVAGRETTKELGLFQIMEMRSVIGLLLLSPLVLHAGGLAAMKTAHPFQHISRNVAHYGGQSPGSMRSPSFRWRRSSPSSSPRRYGPHFWPWCSLASG